MALIKNKYCVECESYQPFCNHRCPECCKRNYILETAIWNALTVDERLRDLRKRIEKLEQGPITY